MSGIKGKTVIITGASSGIGEATAALLAERGAKLMLAARREDRLKSLASELAGKGAEVDYYVTDVTKRSDVEAMAKKTREKFGRIDVLLNNAGLMPLSFMDKLKVDEWERMVDVNIKGVLYAIAAVLPDFRSRKSGHIINVSSVAGHLVFPAAAVYCGTKFFVTALSEGLRKEAGPDFRVTNISPGAIATELTHTITDDDVKKNFGFIEEIAIPADSIARAIAFAIEQPDNVDVNEIIVRPTAQEL